MVLSHERAHLKRRDNWVKPLAYILLAAHWFNPLVWISYVLLCRDIESACDERVLKDMGREERPGLFRRIIELQRPAPDDKRLPLAFGELSVKGRIKSVLNYKKPGFWISLAALAACAVVAVCFLTDPVKEPEEVEPSPAPLAAEDRGKLSPRRARRRREALPAVDPRLLFVIPKDGEDSDYAPENLTQIREETEELPALYLDSRAAESLERMLSDCR
ncbi:MAG: M56 family metallopeptidase [Oscillospiraceae bacterium]